MSRTKHHRHQNAVHYGHEYGSRHDCNKLYGLSYGKHGRKVLHKELRAEGKRESSDVHYDLAVTTTNYNEVMG